jgi:hypothetical protein
MSSTDAVFAGTVTAQCDIYAAGRQSLVPRIGRRDRAAQTSVYLIALPAETRTETSGEFGMLSYSRKSQQ